MFNCAAETIADDLLYVTGKAMLARDVEMFTPCFSLPTMVETSGGRRLLTTHRDLEETFQSVCQYFDDHGVVDMARTIVSSSFLDADTIGSTHATSLLSSDGSSLRASFPVYSVIKRFDKSWKIVSSLYAILDCPKHNSALISEPDPTLIWEGKT